MGVGEAIHGAGLEPGASPKGVRGGLRALGPIPAPDLESPCNSAFFLPQPRHPSGLCYLGFPFYRKLCKRYWLLLLTNPALPTNLLPPLPHPNPASCKTPGPHGSCCFLPLVSDLPLPIAGCPCTWWCRHILDLRTRA